MRVQISAPKIGKLVKKNEMGDTKVEKWVKKIQMNDLKSWEQLESRLRVWPRKVQEARAGCDVGRSW